MSTHGPTAPSLWSRRSVLVVGGAAAAAGALAGAQPAEAAAAATGPFQHGVASGDPLPTSVLLWTRVTPTEAAQPGSGAGPTARVRWEVASDERFRRVVARGAVRTGPQRDHTVKVDAGGLEPGGRYWYRFHLGDQVSPVGRTATAPPAAALVPRLRLGVVSCSNWQAGYFSAYRHLAARGDLDAVVHLGDYLYEYAPGEYQARDVVVRPHSPAKEMTSLADYRQRHAQYKTDPDLQALHAAVPFIVTWDDHESANDAWSGGAENHTEGAEGTWTARRASSQQAYAEWMPVRYEPGGRLYRQFRAGRLATLSMLDLRSYRDRQPANPVDPAQGDAGRTITGPDQLRFLLEALADTGSQWKLVGNPVMISPVRLPSGLTAAHAGAVGDVLGAPAPAAVEVGVAYNVDQWDGYPVERRRVLDHLSERGIRDAVFLTGDIHSAWACDLPADPATYPATGASLATELVCTSVTSDNLDDILRQPPRTASLGVEAAVRANNPHVKHLDFDSHGYSVLDVTPEQVQMDWYVLEERTDPRSGSALSTSWVVGAGTQRVSQAAEGIG